MSKGFARAHRSGCLTKLDGRASLCPILLFYIVGQGDCPFDNRRSYFSLNSGVLPMAVGKVLTVNRSEKSKITLIDCQNSLAVKSLSDRHNVGVDEINFAIGALF